MLHVIALMVLLACCKELEQTFRTKKTLHLPTQYHQALLLHICNSDSHSGIT
jgi:hypothetical protein